jgi:serine/threonine-protein kinase
MGSVYLAEDERLGRRVALKIVLPELADQISFRRRFETEARAAAAIDHRNVVPILSAGSVEGNLYLAMRYVDGPNLEQALRASGPLTPTDAVRILAAVAAGLDAAHAAGLVHRDVSPANILLEGEFGRGGVYLTDFGLVRGVDASATRLTNTGQLIANLDYASPEQVKSGWVDARTDFYSLGCVLYRMLSGSRPFPGTDTQKMWNIVNEPIPPLPEGGALDPVIARATAKDPAARFRSAGGLAKAGLAVIEGRPAGPDDESVASGAAATGYSEAAEEPAETEPVPTEVFLAPEAATQATSAPQGSRMWPRALAAAVLVIAVAAFAAVLLGRGAGGGDNGEQAVTKASRRRVETGQPQRSTASEPTVSTETTANDRSTQGQIYSFEAPVGWTKDPEVPEEPPYYPNLWRQPSDEGSAYVRAEGTTAVEGQDPVEAEEASRRKTAKSPDYHEIGFGSATLDGRAAVRWDYEVEGDRRVVFGFVECGTGLGFVGSADPSAFASQEGAFEASANSLRANCGGNSAAPVVKTYGPGMVEPARLFVSPTNGPEGRDLTWSDWGEPRAVANGTIYYDTCEPDCAEGYGSTTGKVVLTHLHKCEGQLQYTVVRLLYDGLPEHDFWGDYGCADYPPRIHIGG